jgi:hypothetical protein
VTEPQPILEFDSAPVQEVALAAHFATLGGLKAVHLAGLQALWPEYPVVEEMAPAPPMPDVLSPPQAMARIQVEMSAAPIFPRYWFRNESVGATVRPPVRC